MMSQDLWELARKSQSQSYSPYSGFKVGAALRTEDGKIYGGCNIENASYGATVCAERVATWKALSENAGAKIREICVLSSSKEPWPPCGMCRQVLSEFVVPGALVHLANSKGIKKTLKFEELFPSSFGSRHLRP